MSDKLICEFNKNPSELIRLTLSEFKGKKYLSLWVFYDASETEIPDWRPSKKGLCLPVHLLDELKEGIEKAAAEVQEKKELSGLGEKGRENGRTDQKDSGACMNGEGHAQNQDAKTRAPREGQGEGTADE